MARTPKSIRAEMKTPTSTTSFPASDTMPCSLSSGIEEINRIHGTDFTLGQVVSYDAGKGRGRRLATITGHEDGFLKSMRDGDNYQYGALWDPSDILPTK